MVFPFSALIRIPLFRCKLLVTTTAFGSCKVVTDPYVAISVITNAGLLASTVKFTGSGSSVVTSRGTVWVGSLTGFSMKPMTNSFALVEYVPKSVVMCAF